MHFVPNLDASPATLVPHSCHGDLCLVHSCLGRVFGPLGMFFTVSGSDSLSSILLSVSFDYVSFSGGPGIGMIPQLGGWRWPLPHIRLVYAWPCSDLC
jgi:hypothetical protein